jgi:hypothetical protein
MEKMNPQHLNAITTSLTPEEQKVLHSVVERAKQNLAEQEQIPSELTLNTNGA